ncbi:MAG: MerR family transcriptional regulator [Candidatus Gastranaerophilales bacterium]|nr:MerR family transcriptional regulator [Candidatus Gastranaerophilales bacterium]
MYTIKEVSEKTGISEHTLRFWAKNELFPEISRNKNNIRMFNENDLAWVKMVNCLRSVGTEIKEVKKYIDLCLEGDSTIKERFEIIKNTKTNAIKKMEELKNQLELLDYKENYYKNLINNHLQDEWNPANQLTKCN